MVGRIIGIDYGARRVGIALSDEAQRFAFAKAIYPNDDKLLDAVTSLAQKEEVTSIVIGESDNPAGGINAIMRRIEIFKRALEVRSGLPVEAVSEVYTSAEAHRALETKVKNRKNKEVAVDAAAAAIILQTYLDSQKNNT